MNHATWFFVSDHDGMELAAFPERDLAEAYMEDMPWEIEQRVIITDPKFAAKALELHDRNLEIATENQRLKADSERMFGILKECGAVLLLPDESYSLLPEKLRTFQKCYMSEKRAKIERGDMMVEAQERAERAEAATGRMRVLLIRANKWLRMIDERRDEVPQWLRHDTDPHPLREDINAELNDAESKLFAKYQLHSDMLHYLAWLEENRVPELKGEDFLCMASDGTTCWGKSYLDAVRVAMEHDKGIQDAAKGDAKP